MRETAIIAKYNEITDEHEETLPETFDGGKNLNQLTI